jgi:three-Cys-motif partner protein
MVEIEYFNDDCNEIIDKIIGNTRNSSNSPLFVLADPYGIDIRRTTVEKIVKLKNPKEIMLNYMEMGVRRTRGVARKAYYGEGLTAQEIKTVETLKEFIGDDVDVIDAGNVEVLEDYVNAIFTSQDLRVVACDIEYPDRNDILYYLLFASRKQRIVEIVKDIYERERKKDIQLTFDEEFGIERTIMFEPRIREIKR